MAGPIKLFQLVQKLYQMLGIQRPQKNEAIAFNSRNLFFLFCYTQLCGSMMAFFLLRASTMLEYGSSFFMFITQFYITVDFLILMLRISKILDLITEFENFIEKSKLVNSHIHYSDYHYMIFAVSNCDRVAHYKCCKHHVQQIK